jgi:hypothetical protein
VVVMVVKVAEGGRRLSGEYGKNLFMSQILQGLAHVTRYFGCSGSRLDLRLMSHQFIHILLKTRDT